ncbi:MAG: RNA polymerase sigma-54 factor [Chlamydiales bacterium]|jgi:RNA polymerase sigma-54 factor
MYKRQFSHQTKQKTSQEIRQKKGLVIYPSLQQSLNFLQAPLQELASLVESELENNPILECFREEDPHYAFDGDEETCKANLSEEDLIPEKEINFDQHTLDSIFPYYSEFGEVERNGQKLHFQNTEEIRYYWENSIQERYSFFGHMMNQARLNFNSPEELIAAEAIIGNCNSLGFLDLKIEDLAIEYGIRIKLFVRVLGAIKSFEPQGSACENTRDYLLFQLAHQGKVKSKAYKIIELHYEELLKNQIPSISKSLKLTSAQIQNIIKKDLSSLKITPCKEFHLSQPQYIYPDVSLIESDDSLEVISNDNTIETVRMNPKYLEMLEGKDLSPEEREYLVEKLNAGKELLQNIHKRSETLLKVVNWLVQFQKSYLSSIDGSLKPLAMRSVAKDLDMHESTVARAVSGKYLECSRGMIPLNQLFSSSCDSKGAAASSHTVKEMIQKIISGEDKKKPLSDRALSEILKKRKISCSRRVVSKYRKALNIPNTSQRKKF